MNFVLLNQESNNMRYLFLKYDVLALPIFHHAESLKCTDYIIGIDGQFLTHVWNSKFQITLTDCLLYISHVILTIYKPEKNVSFAMTIIYSDISSILYTVENNISFNIMELIPTRDIQSFTNYNQDSILYVMAQIIKYYWTYEYSIFQRIELNIYKSFILYVYV